MELEIRGLTKTYGKIKALDNISLSLTEGVYGLLGPNGSGKTTLLSILVGLTDPTAGEVFWQGKKLSAGDRGFYALLGYVPQTPAYYKGFSAQDFLLYLSALKDLDPDTARQRTKEVLQLVGLENEAEKKIGAFSGGMRQRLAIAQAMLNDPKILIMDEPTAGVDPKERIRFRNILSRLSSGRIVILSTHLVSDIEYTSDRVVLLKKGRILSVDTVEKTCLQAKGKVYQVKATPLSVSSWIERYPECSVIHDADGFRVRIISDFPVEGAIPVTATLEDVFAYHFPFEEEE